MLRISSPPPVILSQCIGQVQEINLLKLLMFAPCYRDPNSTRGWLSLKEALKPPTSSRCVLKGFCHVGFGLERTYGEASARFSVSRVDFSAVRSTGKFDNPAARFSAFPRAAWLCSCKEPQCDYKGC